MQRKDVLRFLLVGGLFFIGMLLLRQHVFPPPPPVDKQPDEDAKLTPSEKNLRAAGTLASFAGQLALEKKADQDREKERLAREEKLPASEKNRRAAGTLASFGGQLALQRALEKKLAARVKLSPADITLGSNDPDNKDNFHLQVVFSPRGASVQRIVLNKFKQADQNGRPTPEVLELVPAPSPEHPLPSNLLYHFNVDRPKDEHPLDTLGKEIWKVDEKETKTTGDTQKVSFYTTIQGVRITKTFTLARGEYHLGLEVKLKRAADAPKNLKFRYQLTGGHGLPLEGRWYTSTFRHSLIGLLKDGDLERNSQDLKELAVKEGGEAVTPDRGKGQFIQYAAIAVQYFASVIAVDNDQEKRDFLASARPTLEARVVKIKLEEDLKPGEDKLKIHDSKDKSKSETYYLGPKVMARLSGGLPKDTRFGLLCLPEPDPDRAGSFRLVGVKLLSEAETQPLFLDDIIARVNTEQVELSGDTEVVHKYLLYNGPIKPMLLGQMKGKEAVDAGLVKRYVDDLHLNTLTDYQAVEFSSKIGWTYLLIFFTNLMHKVLWWIHVIIPNYGICIILLTVLVRGLMFPISRKQALTSMKMQALAPELKKLQEKFKEDPRAKTEAMMALYRKHGVNPLGSCWLLLLQMPIFMGLYYALQESVHFRLAGFLWIDNLAAPDMLIHWGDKIPWISRPEDYGGLLYLGPYFNLLPVLAVTLMIFQQKMLMPPPTDEQQVTQMKIMKYMMIFMGLLFYKVAAGLCIYFIASSVWGFAERKLLPKKKLATDGPTADSLFQRMTTPAARDAAPEAARESITTTPETWKGPAGNGDSGAILSNRARRRQERKRRQEREQIQTTPSAAARAEEPSRRPPADGATSGKGLRGWWAGVRRKLGTWWKDVLKKASKK